MTDNALYSLFSLVGLTAVVSGSMGLLGRNHCFALAQAGANVVVTDLNESACKDFAKKLADQFMVDCAGFGCDITDKASIENLKDKILGQFGSLEILVNNAAINDMFENPTAAAEHSKFENYPLELFQRSLDVNVTGMFLCSQILGSVMAEQGYGSIINIASTYALVAPDQSLYQQEDGTQIFFKSAAYPVTKGAVISFTRFLATYWGHRNVRVNSLSPGGVENKQGDFFVENYAKRTPLGRMAAPDDYRGAIVFLASDASRYMTGANLVVDGGWTAW